MARQVLLQLIDDVSGEEAQETVRFSLDGVDYEIDLTEGHAVELRGALDRFVAHGRRARGASVNRPGTRGPVNREEVRKIREWALANGHNPSARGRISQDIRDAYVAANA
jgi:hypothetical protein